MDEDLKKCSQCKMISSKCNFNKDISTKDGLNPICKVCTIGYYDEKRKQRIECSNSYARKNRAKINLYEKKEKQNKLQISLYFEIKN